MALVLNGDGNITGLLAGGLPDGSVTADDIASLPAGSVLQVVQAVYSTTVNITSDSFVDSGLSASITPSDSSSKILVMCSFQLAAQQSNADRARSGWKILRGATDIMSVQPYSYGMIQIGGTTGETFFVGHPQVTYLDSPNTTLATTYKLQLAKYEGQVILNYGAVTNGSTIILMEIAA